MYRNLKYNLIFNFVVIKRKYREGVIWKRFEINQNHKKLFHYFLEELFNVFESSFCDIYLKLFWYFRVRYISAFYLKKPNENWKSYQINYYRVECSFDVSFVKLVNQFSCSWNTTKSSSAYKMKWKLFACMCSYLLCFLFISFILHKVKKRFENVR